MSADILHVFDFSPRKPHDPHTENLISADLHMIDRVIQWMVEKKTTCAREAKPLLPADRLMVMDVSDALEL